MTLKVASIILKIHKSNILENMILVYQFTTMRASVNKQWNIKLSTAAEFYHSHDPLMDFASYICGCSWHLIHKLTQP